MTTPTTQKDDIELQKLSFEKEKYSLEEGWKRKAFIWSIASTVLGSAVTVAIALITNGFHKPPSPPLPSGITSSAVEDCRLSLQRLPTLALQENQTVPNLREAINRHVSACDQVLIEMRTFLAGSGR